MFFIVSVATTSALSPSAYERGVEVALERDVDGQVADPVDADRGSTLTSRIDCLP